MPRKPDLPCAVCGQLMGRTATSLPEGQATCHPCRRARMTQQKTCAQCSAVFQLGKYQAAQFCSRDCANKHNRGGSTALPEDRLHPCQVCGTIYDNIWGTKTCGRKCGWILRNQTNPPKPQVCEVRFTPCEMCGATFQGRGNRCPTHRGYLTRS